MRSTALALIAALIPALLPSQEPEAARSGSLPRDVRRAVEARWNADVALRSSTASTIEDDRTVSGDVAVRNGPLQVHGHVTGNVLAINADVILAPSARVDGDILVVGGDVRGRHDAHVGGDISIYRQPVRYREEAGTHRIVVEGPSGPVSSDDVEWWRRWDQRGARSWSDPFRIASAGAYNRVEGLPVNVGPVIYHSYPWGSVRFDGFGVIRTGTTFDSSVGDVGHDVSTEIRFGRRHGVSFGGRLFNVVEPVEEWQLTNIEAGLASFLVHRDYRDHYQRHGGSMLTRLLIGPNTRFTTTYSAERWLSRPVYDPFTLFRNRAQWRPNPAMDEGPLHLVSSAVEIDTRTSPRNPWSGWLVRGEFERGWGTFDALAPASRPRQLAAGDPFAYSSAFADVRRYNRLSPRTQVNLRVVGGGWVSGDELPMQRRVSVDGPGALPGFGFRVPRMDADLGTCNVGGPAGQVFGQPAQCDRMILGQIEYRTDLRFDHGWGDHRRGRGGRVRSDAGAAWVIFADAGRGWLVGDGSLSPELEYPAGRIPPIGTFRSEIGAGLDLGMFGVYAAKPVSHPSEPARGFIRLNHRF